MSNESPPTDMKTRALAALKAKQAAAAASNTHGDTKTQGKTGAKVAKQPKQRIIRHQGR